MPRWRRQLRVPTKPRIIRVVSTGRPVIEKFSSGILGCNLQRLGGLWTFLIHTQTFWSGLAWSNDLQESYFQLGICPWFFQEKVSRFEGQIFVDP